MYNKNAYDLVSEVRSALDEAGVTSGKWSDTEIVKQINNAKNHYVNVVNTINRTVNGRTASITYVAGTELYDLPGDLDNIIRIEITGTKQKVNLIDMDKKEQYRAANDFIDTLPSYYPWGSQIGLINVSADVTIWYTRRVPDIHYGTAAAGSATSLTFATNPNGSTSGDYTKKYIADYYTGAYLHIYSGTGAGQIMLITSNTAAGVVSFATATTPPDVTSKYALQYDLPIEIDQCIILMAAIFLCPKDRTKSIASLSSILTLLQKTMTDGLPVAKERTGVEYIS